MPVPDDHLRININTKNCDIPTDERTRLLTSLTPLADAVRDVPNPALRIEAIYHPESTQYHVEFKLTLPGRTLFTGDEAPYLDSALQCCVRKLRRRVEAYREHPDREVEAASERRNALDQNVVAPEAPDTGPLAQVVETGDYRAFRIALVGYEDWLRKRVGRLIQRDPQAQARVGTGLLIGDVVEEVYLNAFEQFTRRPIGVRLSDWLESLIEPSIRGLLRDPDLAEEASIARTVRETPMT